MSYFKRFLPKIKLVLLSKVSINDVQNSNLYNPFYPILSIGRRDSMGIFKGIGKIGIIVSFIAALAYELTGASFLKAISIVTGALSLVILSSYLTQIKGISKARDVLVFLRLLR